MLELEAHPSIANTITKGIFDLNLITYVVEKPCPNCGGQMRAYREATEDTPPRCPPVCMNVMTETDKSTGKARKVWSGCGYRDRDKKNAINTIRMYNQSLKSKNFDVFKYGSIVNDGNILLKTMEEFIERDEESRSAKNTALNTVKEILEGVPAHFMLNGTAGVGKSHLAVSLIKKVMVESGYNKKVMFVSYPELYNQMKFAVQDKELMKKLTHQIIADIKTVDVVAIDDIGAELGKIGSNTHATDYNVNLLQQIVDARANKATIFTTNLNSKEITNFYGERIMSRILSNITKMDGTMRIETFKNTKDGRLGVR